MAVNPMPNAKSLLADKHAVQKAIAQHNAQLGFVPGPAMTPQQLRERMRAEGILAQDNAFSRGILAMRDEE